MKSAMEHTSPYLQGAISHITNKCEFWDRALQITVYNYTCRYILTYIFVFSH